MMMEMAILGNKSYHLLKGRYLCMHELINFLQQPYFLSAIITLILETQNLRCMVEIGQRLHRVCVNV